ncbi:KH domain RNA binding protein YlqC [Olavius sp. associated proteobacterium Delta 1]|nr:KH domain RNA binding protein YlqC [Olavius sp. associated proteobacterium Delta 1]
MSIQPGTERGNGMKDLISDIAKALVDPPDQVSVTEIEGGHTVILELSVAKSDMGMVIGKKGRNALALRTILSAAAGKTGKRYVLEIVE